LVVLSHAGQALYYAKKNGRNQICLYDELASSEKLCTQVSNDCAELF
jgi:hypothetical protein